MKQLKKICIAFAVMGALTTGIYSCKSGPKDADIKTQIETVLPTGVSIDVKKGEATLSGEFLDDIAKQEAEKTINAIPGVKKVIDNATVKPVEISADTELISKVNEILKAYTGVTADIKDGIVTLNGEFKRDELPKLMQAVQALQPKKVENKLILK